MGAAPALQHTLALLESSVRPPGTPVADGYLDLLAGAEPAPARRAQRLMLTSALPVVYTRWWRPALGRLAKGGSGMEDERRVAHTLLALEPGDAVLDVACGTGSFARAFARVVGPDGLVVGIDASRTMLARAVRETGPEANIAYVRGDAERLPFRPAAFDAVCCFAALHLFDDPWSALDEMARVLTPGGRLALLASCGGAAAPVRLLEAGLGAALDVRVFGADELTGALAVRGFEDVRQRVRGLVQFVGGRAPYPG